MSSQMTQNISIKPQATAKYSREINLIFKEKKKKNQIQL